MSPIVGYARGSAKERNPDAQTAELRAAGYERAVVSRGESSKSLGWMRSGDTLVVLLLDGLTGRQYSTAKGTSIACQHCASVDAC